MLDTSHSQRLTADLAAIRMLQEMNRGNDALDAQLASIVLMQTRNLRKADDAEADLATAGEINAMLQQLVTRIEQITGVSLANLDFRVADNFSDEAKHQVASLQRMRQLFEASVLAEDVDPKDLKHLAGHLIGAEKVLWSELQECGAYRTLAQVEAICAGFFDKVVAEVKPKVCEDVWPGVVDRIFDASTAIVEAMTADDRV